MLLFSLVLIKDGNENSNLSRTGRRQGKDREKNTNQVYGVGGSQCMDTHPKDRDEIVVDVPNRKNRHVTRNFMGEVS